MLGLWLMLSAVALPHLTSAGSWNQGVVGYSLVLFGFIPRAGSRKTEPTAPVNF
ncbi:MAG TPA: hypothetical protein VH853_17045 [Polyangia bacterium]|jgi:hypothetical protein|nr:hypothetical protein [Polyangia bacterium]